MNGGVYRAAHICPHCLYEHEGGKKSRKAFRKTTEVSTGSPEIAEAEVPTAPHIATPKAAPHVTTPKAPAQAAPVVLTAKSADEHKILKVFENVVAECALNIQRTPDLFSNGKFVGAKSEKVKAAVAQGKKNALVKLRQQAQELGANIVTDIAVSNSVKAVDAKNISIIVKVAGTAAKAELAQDACEV